MFSRKLCVSIAMTMFAGGAVAKILPQTMVVSQFEHYMVSEQPRGYLGRYADQPLCVDPELPADPDRSGIYDHTYWGRFSSQANWEAAQKLADGYGIDGFAFFPGPERMRYWGAGEKSAVPNFLNLPIITFWFNWSPAETVECFRRAIANKRGYSFDGKALILSYWTEKFNSPEKLKGKLDAVRKEVGDTFWFVPDLSSIANGGWEFNRNAGRFSDEQTRKLQEVIRAYLRVADGVYCGDTFGVFTYERKHRIFYSDFWRDAVNITKGVLTEPEFAGKKFLGLSATVSHCNTSRQYYTPHEDGTRTVRSSLSISLDADPDFVMLPEWDEFNENTSFCPTLMNGFTTKRIVRQLIAAHRGESPSPLAGDDVTKPNLVVSVRPNLDPGEVLTVEVLSVPDGTFAEPIQVALVLTDAEGRDLKRFKAQTLDGAKLEDVRFEAASEELAAETRVVRLKLAWRCGEKSGVVSEGLPNVGIVSGSGWNCKWAHQSLRDLAPVKATFDVSDKATATVSCAEPIRYAMLFGNGSIQYIQGAANDPFDRFHEDEETAVFEINPFAHRHFKAPRGQPFTVIAEGVSSCEWLDDKGTGRICVTDGSRLELPWISHIAERAYVRVPKRELATAKLVFAFGDVIRGAVSLAAAYDKGLYVLTADRGAQLVVSRFQKQPFYPIPAKVGECAFAVRPYVERPSMAYELLVVTMSGKTWRSHPVVRETPSDVVSTRAYSEFKDALVDVRMPRSRLPNLKYDFGAGVGDALLSGAGGGRAFTGVRGGPVGGVVQMNRNQDNFTEAGCVASFRSWATNTLPGRFETDAGTALALDGIDDYFELPWGAIPVDGIYELAMEIRPERTNAVEMIAVSRAALQLTSDRGELVVDTYSPDSIFNSYVPERRTGLCFVPGVWNKLRIRALGDSLEVLLNGHTARLKTRAPTIMCSTVLFGLSTQKSFESFKGAIRNLTIDHAVTAEVPVVLWPEGRMPDRQAVQTNAPYMVWHTPKELKSKAILIAVSGGGYKRCSIDGFEVDPIRDYFLDRGVTVVTMKYRTPRPEGIPFHQTAWQDAQRTVRLVRREAKRRGLDPENIGFTGCSAGGHLTLLVATSSQTPAYAPVDEVDAEPCHVNWAIPVYAAYALSDVMDGSSPNLEKRGNDLSVPLSPYLKFDGKTCPMCFFCGDADWWTMHSVRVYHKLRTMDIPAELHTFVKEQHCFMRDPKPGTNAANWKDIVWGWIVRMEIDKKQ